MKEKKVIVSLKGISKTYDNDVKVVKNIDLDIYEGEFLTILGASGCGKTTTLRMIAGFEDVSSGDICIDGSSVIGCLLYTSIPLPSASPLSFQLFSCFG